MYISSVIQSIQLSLRQIDKHLHRYQPLILNIYDYEKFFFFFLFHAALSAGRFLLSDLTGGPIPARWWRDQFYSKWQPYCLTFSFFICPASELYPYVFIFTCNIFNLNIFVFPLQASCSSLLPSMHAPLSRRATAIRCSANSNLRCMGMFVLLRTKGASKVSLLVIAIPTGTS